MISFNFVGTMSFTNPMFDVDPPSNIYSDEPNIDITFGVDNPGYVPLDTLLNHISIGVHIWGQVDGDLWHHKR